MPMIAAAIAIVAEAVWAAIAAVAVFVSTVVGTIATFVAGIAAVIGSALAAAAGAVAQAVVIVGLNIWEGVTWLGDWIATHTHYVFEFLQDWIKGVVYDFEKLLATIHFKEIMAINSMAMLVSEDYRNMMKKVYKALGQLSDALELGTNFIVLAVRNTRNLVLDVSTMMGAKYDLAEVAWLAEFNKFTQHIQKYAYAYKNNPEQLLTDLANAIEIPAMNTKGSFMQQFISTVSDLGKISEKIVTDVGIVTKDLNALISGLPSTISDAIKPGWKAWNTEWTEFQNSTFKPSIQTIQGITKSLGADMEKTKTELAAAAAKIKTPKENLTAIKTMSVLDQQEVLDGLTRVENELDAKQYMEFSLLISPVHEEFSQLLKEPVTSRPPPSFLKLEPSPVGVGTETLVSRVTSPFVGDY